MYQLQQFAQHWFLAAERTIANRQRSAHTEIKWKEDANMKKKPPQQQEKIHIKSYGNYAFIDNVSTAYGGKDACAKAKTCSNTPSRGLDKHK